MKFDAPVQVANTLVRTGSPPQFVTQINFGSPMVVSSFGPLTNQPLVLDLAGNSGPFYYDQIQFNMSSFPGRGTYDMSFDFTAQGLVGSPADFIVWFDGAYGQMAYFKNDGRIMLYSYDDQGFPYSATVGTFTNGEAFNFRVQVDDRRHIWTAYRDGILLGDAPLRQAPGGPSSIRMSFGVTYGSSPDSSGVGIDNILIGIPEPRPVIGRAGGNVTLSWAAVPGTTYRVQYKHNLGETNWTALFPDVTAAGNLAFKSESIGTNRERYYQVIIP